MRSDHHPNKPANAFAADFLHRLGHRSESHTAAEAELAGPWKVCEVSPGHGVFRHWERPDGEAGDLPEAVFEHREHALLLAAVLDAVGREPLFRLDPTERAEGYAVETMWGDAWVRTVGRLRRFQPEAIDALHLAEAVVRSPQALANLLEAAGATALDLVGEILGRRFQNGGTGAGEQKTGGA